MTTDRLEDLAPHIAQFGFDWIELPLESIENIDYERAAAIIGELGWAAPWVLISAVTHSGTQELMQRVSVELTRIRESEPEMTLEPDVAGREGAAD